MSLFLFIFLILSQQSLSHMRLLYPPPRTNDAALTESQVTSSGSNCGVTRRGVTTTLTANTQIDVYWAQTVKHAGSEYRIAISRNDSSDMTDYGYESCILLNHIPETTFDTTRRMVVRLTLPNINCESCTLMVTQYIPQNNANKDNPRCCLYENEGIKPSNCEHSGAASYRSCANIVITGGNVHRNNINQCNQPSNWDYLKGGACNVFGFKQSAVHWNSPNQNANSNATLTLNTGRPQDDVTSGCGGSSTDCQRFVDNSKPVGFNDLVGSVPFLQGGTMQAGGIIAIILLVILIIGIIIGVIVKKKSAQKEGTASN